jgi:hypothetical protein
MRQCFLFATSKNNSKQLHDLAAFIFPLSDPALHRVQAVFGRTNIWIFEY